MGHLAASSQTSRVDKRPKLFHIPPLATGTPPQSSRFPTMVSRTAQSDSRRLLRTKTAGKANKKANVRKGTPKFPIHLEGYSAAAADAKKA